MRAKADVLVIGGGPGGYVAALRAAQLGARTVLVEKDRLGGTCLNWGCIPTKALLEVAKAADLAARGRELGVRVTGVEIDLGQVRRYRDRVVRQLVGGVRSLLAAAGVEVVAAEGRVAGPGVVTAAGERLQAENVVIATGSTPAMLPLGIPPEHLWDSTRALELAAVPRHLAVIGGGPVGLEFATIYRALGAEVTVIEVLPRLLAREDEEIGELLAQALRRRGIEVRTAVRVSRVEGSPEQGFRLWLQPGGAPAAGSGADAPPGSGADAVVEADAVLMAVGRRPATAGLGLAELGLGEGWIDADERQRTRVPGLYAVGDVTGRHLLAHAASAQGVVAAESATGHVPVVRLDHVPSCVFTWPEVASVGMTAPVAREAGLEVTEGRFPFAANGRAATMGERQGLVKVVAEKVSGRLVGAHIIGPEASTMIHEIALGLTVGATLADVEATIHAHPTVSEALAEACLAAGGRALHLPMIMPAGPKQES